MNKFRIEFRWALIFTMAYLLWMYFEKAMGWHDELIGKQALYTNFFGIIAIILYVCALINKRESIYNGVMDWKKGFLAGAVLSVMIAAITPLSQYIVFTYISPGFFDHIIAFRDEHSTLDRQFIEDYYTMSSFIFQSIFYTLSYGIVTAGIVAWFVKKEGGNSDKPME